MRIAELDFDEHGELVARFRVSRIPLNGYLRNTIPLVSN